MSKIRGNLIGTTMAPEKIAERVGGGGGGVAPLIVAYYDQTGKASHSSTEIFEASLQRPVVLVHASKREHYQLDYCTEFAASFTRMDDTRILEQWVVDEAKVVDYYYHGAIVTQTQLDNAIGDIETALDELHAYAQALIGGDTE